jgi:hypothetical protein
VACVRMGAEQEMFLVDQHLRPAPIAVELLAGLDDPRLTTEIAVSISRPISRLS